MCFVDLGGQRILRMWYSRALELVIDDEGKYFASVPNVIYPIGIFECYEF